MFKHVEMQKGAHFTIVSTILLAPVVQTLDSAIHRINHYPGISIRETNYAIRWIVIYPVDSAIQPLNNWGLIGLGSKIQENFAKQHVCESLKQNLMSLNKTDIPCQEHKINVKFSSVGYCLQLL